MQYDHCGHHGTPCLSGSGIFVMKIKNGQVVFVPAGGQEATCNKKGRSSLERWNNSEI